jgi:hypothetical protein
MRRTVCVDFDGVIADYSKGWQGFDKAGDPIPGAKEFLAALAEFADVVIYTTRCCEDLNGRNGMKANLLQNIIREYLDKHGLKYHNIYIGQGKPIASCYIDDRAISCIPQEDARAYDSAIAKAKRFCKVEQDKGE